MSSSGNDEKSETDEDEAAAAVMEAASDNPRKRQRKETSPQPVFPPQEGEKPTPQEKKSKKQDGWMHFYNKLVAYKAKHGSVEVPQRYKDDPALGSWCKNQREYYKNFCNNKTSSLTQERIDLLNEIGFAWLSTKTKRRVVKDFDAHFEELQEFKRENGHTRVPHVYDPNPGLGVFCHRCKIYYREMQQGKRKSPNDWLTPQRIQALQDLEFEWKVGRWKGSLSWNDRYQQLLQFHTLHGHANVTKQYDEEHAPGLKLWITNQRTYLMRASASTKRVAKAVAASQEKKQLLQNLGVDFQKDETTAPQEDLKQVAEELGIPPDGPVSTGKEQREQQVSEV